MLIELGEKECIFVQDLLDSIELQTPLITGIREKLKGIRPPRREKRNTSVTLYADQVEHFAPSELSCNLREIIDMYLKEDRD